MVEIHIKVSNDDSSYVHKDLYYPQDGAALSLSHHDEELQEMVKEAQDKFLSTNPDSKDFDTVIKFKMVW